jgi:succinate dehydrogenase hydrophobic anchor subunit
MNDDNELIPPQTDDEYPIPERLEKWLLSGCFVACVILVALAGIGLWTVGEWIFR